MVVHVIGAFIGLPVVMLIWLIAIGLFSIGTAALAWVLYHAAPGWWARTLERSIEREEGR